MKNGFQKSLFGIPTWLLSLIISFIAIIVLIVIASLLGSINGIDKNISEGISYLIYGLIVSAGCFIFVRTILKAFGLYPYYPMLLA